LNQYSEFDDVKSNEFIKISAFFLLFGTRFLDRVEGHYPFIILSFVIRIVEAMGNAAFLTASFAIIAMEFPDNVATTFVRNKTKYINLFYTIKYVHNLCCICNNCRLLLRRFLDLGWLLDQLSVELCIKLEYNVYNIIQFWKILY